MQPSTEISPLPSDLRQSLKILSQCSQGQCELSAVELGKSFQNIINFVSKSEVETFSLCQQLREMLNGAEPSNDASPEPPRPSSAARMITAFLDALSLHVEATTDKATAVALLKNLHLPPDHLRQSLESNMLEELGLIRNTFIRIGIRQQTNLLYRQSNYNLLREEAEGYSKLITELFTTSNTEIATSEVVERTFERIEGMIGAFDLDVGRVLDITLDIFAAVLVKQYRFFVKYLRISSWWPSGEPAQEDKTAGPSAPLPDWALPGQGLSECDIDPTDHGHARAERDVKFWLRCKEIGLGAFYEIGKRTISDQALEAQLTASEKSEMTAMEIEWLTKTRTIPPQGNRVAAQILGFKLRYYASTARSPSETLPSNLIYLAALLIKIGFISLCDLYAHIWPEDAQMDESRESRAKAKIESEKLAKFGSSGPNALINAAPLPDDTIDLPVRDQRSTGEAALKRRRLENFTMDQTEKPVQDSDAIPEPSDQKFQLLQSLLVIGALPEALFMLGRFPWLLELSDDLFDPLHRILHHCLSKVYASLQPLQSHKSLNLQSQIVDLNPGVSLKGQIDLIDQPARKIMRWAQLDKNDVNEAIDYRFYWDDWADLVPICQDVDDVFTLCSSFLNVSGIRVGKDPSLLAKIARIGVHSIRVDSSPANFERWIDLSKRLLVPALSFTRCNPGVVNEVFELIKSFNTSTRYNIYAEWTYGQTSRIPEIKTAFDRTRAETRDVLKRISKTTIKPMARALAKIAYASPAIVFSVALSQLEAYDNIVDTFVECGRYFTFLAYDVLTWSLMSALGNSGRHRVQDDGMLTSKWLAALSLFAGKVFKRYSIMNPLPIVQYVADQARQGNAADLLVLENITRSMAGIISDSSLSEPQIIAMSGGELLRSQTLKQLLDRRHESKTTARRLIRPLVESGIAGQVLVTLAQERHLCIFRIQEADAHPKLLGNLFDQIHRVFCQYLDFLRSNLSLNEFNSLVPDISALIAEFGVEPALAFAIFRPSISARMAEYDLSKAANSPNDPGDHEPSLNKIDDEAALHDADIMKETPSDTKVDESSEQIQANLSTESREAASTDAENADDHMATAEISGIGADKTDVTDKQDPGPSCHPVLNDIVSKIQIACPAQTWQYLSPSFFVTFWQLSLGDVFTSLEPYHDAQKRLEKTIKTISDDRTDISTAGQLRKNREKQSLMDTVGRLHKEMKECMQANIACKARLRREKDNWFSGNENEVSLQTAALIEHCFLPRLKLSPLDAMYTFKMIKLLHSENAANFKTISVYDQIFDEKRLASIIFLCTAKEAECFGRFLNDLLRDLGNWHADKAVFEREAFGSKANLSGFLLQESDKPEFANKFDFEAFRRQLLKWHRNLNGALKACYASQEYMHIRNAINILNQIHQNFPVINWMGNNQLTAITEMSKQEKREDVKIAATSLIGALKKRERSWMMPQAFNVIENASAGTRGSQEPTVKQLNHTQNQEAETFPEALNPRAPEFRSVVQHEVSDPMVQSSSPVEHTKNVIGPKTMERPIEEEVPVSKAISDEQPGPHGPGVSVAHVSSPSLTTQDKVPEMSLSQNAASSNDDTPGGTADPARPLLQRETTGDSENGSCNAPNRMPLPLPPRPLSQTPFRQQGRYSDGGSARIERKEAVNARQSSTNHAILPRGQENEPLSSNRGEIIAGRANQERELDPRNIPETHAEERLPEPDQDQSRNHEASGPIPDRVPNMNSSSSVSLAKAHPDRAALIVRDDASEIPPRSTQPRWHQQPQTRTPFPNQQYHPTDRVVRPPGSRNEMAFKEPARGPARDGDYARSTHRTPIESMQGPPGPRPPLQHERYTTRQSESYGRLNNTPDNPEQSHDFGENSFSLNGGMMPRGRDEMRNLAAPDHGRGPSMRILARPRPSDLNSAAPPATTRNVSGHVHIDRYQPLQPSGMGTSPQVVRPYGTRTEGFSQNVRATSGGSIQQDYAGNQTPSRNHERNTRQLDLVQNVLSDSMRVDPTRRRFDGASEEQGTNIRGRGPRGPNPEANFPVSNGHNSDTRRHVGVSKDQPIYDTRGPQSLGRNAGPSRSDHPMQSGSHRFPSGRPDTISHHHSSSGHAQSISRNHSPSRGIRIMQRPPTNNGSNPSEDLRQNSRNHSQMSYGTGNRGHAPDRDHNHNDRFRNGQDISHRLRTGFAEDSSNSPSVRKRGRFDDGPAPYRPPPDGKRPRY